MSVILVFIACTSLVAWFSWKQTKETDLSTSEGYFLGGRSLSWGVIGGSLLLTNLQATTFLGFSGQAYSANMSAIGFEVGAALALVVVALVMAPRYLAQGLATIPQFLEKRFDSNTRNIVALVFLLGYIVNGLPPTLYSGAVALGELFQVRQMFDITYEQSLWMMVVAIGVVGSLYAILGGLRAVAISDTINGVGLLIGGLLVPYFGLVVLGDGSFGDGLDKLFTQHPEKLNAIGSASDPIPFSTLFTGVVLLNLYYWGTDQSIIQRVLGAKDLKNAQKGVLLAGFFKVLTPLICILPGVIAFHLYAGTLTHADTAYSVLASSVLPKALIGIFAAVFFGAVLSSFNSILNSTATLFALNIYKPLMKGKASEKQVVFSGKVFGIFVAVAAIGIAPFIQYASHGLMEYVQIVNGFFYVPILTVVLIGYFFRRVPPFAVKIGLIFFLVAYGSMQLVVKPDIHFLHQLGILFVLSGGFMVLMGYFFPVKEPYEIVQTGVVDMEPWKYRHEASVGVVSLVLCSYIVFSDLGLSSGNLVSMFQYMSILFIAAIVIIFILLKNKRKAAAMTINDSVNELDA